jgi:hypothetical protein
MTDFKAYTIPNCGRLPQRSFTLCGKCDHVLYLSEDKCETCGEPNPYIKVMIDLKPLDKKKSKLFPFLTSLFRKWRNDQA